MAVTVSKVKMEWSKAGWVKRTEATMEKAMEKAMEKMSLGELLYRVLGGEREAA